MGVAKRALAAPFDSFRCRARGAALRGSDQRYGTVVVAVVTVGMVQVPIHEVVDVVAVRYGRMATTGTVHVVRIMARTLVLRALRGVRSAHVD